MSDNVQETTNDTVQAATSPTPADMPQQAAQPEHTNEQAATEQNTIDSLPDWVQSHIKELREENAKHRNKAKTAAEEAAQREKELATQARDQLVNDLAKALGIGGEEEEQDPQALLEAANQKSSEQQQRIDELIDEVNSYKRTEAVRTAVGDRKVNQKLLNALLALDNGFQSVDPNIDGYADQVSEAVNKVIDANPEIVQVTRGQSSVDPSNTRNGENPITREDLKTMSPEDINKAARDGLLDHLIKN